MEMAEMGKSLYHKRDESIDQGEDGTSTFSLEMNGVCVRVCVYDMS